MKIVKNVGPKDKKIRLFLAFLFFVLSFLIPGLKVLFLILALVLFITSILGFCGLYTLLGINTCKRS
ncbi:MAG: hypothetical protein CH104c_0731 [Candidatus Woesebacteria bacterium]|nr:MAG: hypothetical protein CH104c_0731 [Candidatus Woesebacteria bacterium]